MKAPNGVVQAPPGVAKQLRVKPSAGAKTGFRHVGVAKRCTSAVRTAANSLPSDLTSSKCNAARPLCAASHQRAKPGLNEVLVGRQRFLNPGLSHRNEGNTVDQAPLLILTGLVQSERLREQVWSQTYERHIFGGE